MAAPWRRCNRPLLEAQPWTHLKAADGQDLLVKGLFQENGYHVMLCDLENVWEESVESEDISGRSKALNPNVEAPTATILHNLASHLDVQRPGTVYAARQQEGETCGLVLALSTKISGLPYQWEFRCTEPPTQNVKVTHLVMPLVTMAAELSRRQQELFKLLAKKDREIQELRENRGTLRRRNLETGPFDPKTFTNDMSLSKDFEQVSQDPLKSLSSSDTQALYKDTALLLNWITNAADYEEEVDVGMMADGSTTGTWAGKIPVSLLPAVSVATRTVSPVTSPVKRPAAVMESPTKMDEQVRRDELEKKLEEEKTRGKKKKKLLV